MRRKHRGGQNRKRRCVTLVSSSLSSCLRSAFSSILLMVLMIKSSAVIHAVLQHFFEAVLYGCDIFVVGHAVPGVVGLQNLHGHLAFTQQLPNENRDQILCSQRIFRYFRLEELFEALLQEIRCQPPLFGVTCSHHLNLTILKWGLPARLPFRAKLKQAIPACPAVLFFMFIRLRIFFLCRQAHSL